MDSATETGPAYQRTGGIRRHGRLSATLVLTITLVATMLPGRAFAATAQDKQALIAAADQEFVYKNVDGRALRLAVHAPEKSNASPPQLRPSIVFFHGGGWTGGKPGQFTEHAKHFKSRGAVCFQVEYRLLDKKGKEPPETCVEDAQDALRWIRARAEQFSIDPQKIASAGGSAGGHLAAYLGCVTPSAAGDRGGQGAQPSAKSNAMLLFNPVYDNGPGGWGEARVGERYPEFSPFHNVSDDDPPSIVFLGTQDALVPVATAEAFRDNMQKLGVRSELILFEGQPHGFFNFDKSEGRYYRETIAAADRFLVQLDWIDAESTDE